MTMGRLKSKIANGVGNAKEDFPRFSGVRGDHVAGNGAGVLIDGVIYPLQGEPPVAKTHGWGRVPGIPASE
jgi:hypothetical protein